VIIKRSKQRGLRATEVLNVVRTLGPSRTSGQVKQLPVPIGKLQDKYRYTGNSSDLWKVTGRKNMLSIT
jgi:hypothetical protein